ncbi:MAG: DUF3843 family protein [Dysgonamonadaceae bacterium]|nr:DUF3843 family protein [Dysgonamonadaceae bacterium]
MNNKIFIKDWLELKPYDTQTKTDGFYLKTCNDVKRAIVTNKYSFILQRFLGEKDINTLSCFVTSYLEDVISGTNIWQSFVKAHLRLYQKHLPFYALDDYDEQEINTQDVSFLIWYFINTIQKEKLIAPYNEFIVGIAENIMDVLDNAWEYAPENDYLKSFYHIDENEKDFYVARKLINTILFETYLFYPDTSLKLLNQEAEIIEKYADNERLLMLLNENIDNSTHNTHTRLLSFKGKEWAAEILGSEHPLKKDFSELSKKISGYFLYKGQDEKNIFIEHIASGKKFDLTKKSFDHSDSLKVVDKILFLGIAKWKDEWWFSGVFFDVKFDADIILEEKNSLESRKAVSFLDHQKKKIDTDKILKGQLLIFKQLNNGSQIAFMPSENIEEFFKEFTNLYNKSLNLSKKVIRETKQRAKDDGYFGEKVLNNVFLEKAETGLIFFNPKSGCEIAFDINSAFPLSSNPYYKEEDSEDHLMFLLLDESLSTELAMYCIDNCKDKLAFFKDGIGKEYLKDIDFLLRFWKRNNYHTEPSVTYTGKESPSLIGE